MLYLTCVFLPLVVFGVSSRKKK